MLTITPKELASLLENTPENIELIDVRRQEEFDEVHATGARLITLDILPERVSEIDKNKQVIYICRSGGRSGTACDITESDGIKGYNLIGGTIAFAKEFPALVVHGEKKRLFGIF